jgi:hypothetical protein
MTMRKMMVATLVMLSACAVAGPAPREAREVQHEDAVVVDVLATPEDWSIPMTDDLAVDVSDVVGSTDEEFAAALAQRLGGAGFTWTGDVEGPPGGPGGTCANTSGWAGCTINIDWARFTVVVRCWVRVTPSLSGYCELGGDVDRDYDGPGGRTRVFMSRPTSLRCGRAGTRVC